ncbi:hypothetical protein MIR68_005327 [Amoeboaphelidium protococcarum]|nr:hypothetical protein MIR68_005327 [Amoeboaphelidium protococcarum]
MSGLVKAKKFNIQDSNIALLGSDLEKNVRKNASDGEPAWASAGKQLGIEIWRIEKFKVVAWPKESYGEFYSGDSYIILRTYKAKPEDEKFQFDVHFWLGRETSQDEAGTAAYKTVELDDCLGGQPVQHREVQGYESELFLSYFPKMKILDGGVESGFKHVKPEEYRPRLLHIKGTRGHIVVQEVALEASSLNSGDVFVLDAGLNIYQFNGATSNGVERMKAMELCSALSQDRKSAKVVVYGEDDADATPFWQLIGGKKAIKSAGDGGDDKAAVKNVAKRLMRLSDASGKIEFKEEATGVIKKSMLDGNDVFIFDNAAEVFAWVGKKTTPQEKRLALQYAQDYLVKYNRPAYTPISRVLEGGENEVFLKSLDPESSAAPVGVKAGKEQKDAVKQHAPVQAPNMKK